MNVRSRDDTFLKSSFYEQLVEHVFISEILQEVYFGHGLTVEVLRSEVDALGCDLVLDCNGILRHIQLKTSKPESRTARQKVNAALGTKPGGCVVWILRHEDPTIKRMRLSYRFFGGAPGKPLPSLAKFKVAKHTKGDASGRKKERPGIRVVPKGAFTTIETTIETTVELVKVLFGLE